MSFLPKICFLRVYLGNNKIFFLVIILSVVRRVPVKFYSVFDYFINELISTSWNIAIPVTTTAMPFYQSGWFIALIAVIGSIITLGVIGGLGYYAYTKMKSTTPAEEERINSNTMEMRRDRPRNRYGIRDIFKLNINLNCKKKHVLVVLLIKLDCNYPEYMLTVVFLLSTNNSKSLIYFCV